MVPWKYGFKSIKSIVKIDLVDRTADVVLDGGRAERIRLLRQREPRCDHPRWSQWSERRIGETGRRKTLPFNGYAEQVAGLYAGMDLATYY